MNNHPDKRLKVFAIASGGGHWVQLLRLRPAFRNCQVTYVTVNAGSSMDIKGEGAQFYTVRDGNKDTKIDLIIMALRILWLLLLTRPNIIVSTGAAPGYFACRFARWIGARSLFIDSVANAHKMSLSAKLATTHANKVFSQWPQVAKSMGVDYHGKVL